MRLHPECDVLIVGAGPVGLFAALRLAQSGRRIRLIDRSPHGNVESYALALHGPTLELLQQVGVLEEVMEAGLPLSRMVFSDRGEPQAALDLYELGGEYPFCLVVPQSALEGTLRRALASRGVKVEWNRAITDVAETDDGVIAVVAHLGEIPQGYGVSDFARVTKSEERVPAGYLVAADGMDSTVRRLLNIPLRHHGERRHFIVFEFEGADAVDGALQVDLVDGQVNVFWPLPGGRGRWTFEVDEAAARNPFPAIETAYALMAQRIPWFNPARPAARWVASVAFDRALAEPFGSGPVWLAGDAAHSALPFGVQSMNAGLQEADLLADCLTLSPPGVTRAEMLQFYGENREIEWKRMLSPEASLLPPCLAAYAPHDIVAAIPATGEALDRAVQHVRPIAVETSS